MSQPQPPAYQVLQQAAAWYALLSSERVSEQDHGKWRHWLGQHVEHRQAWALVERVGGRFGQFNDSAQRQGAFAALQAGATAGISRRRTILSLGGLSLATWLGCRALADSSASAYVGGLLADYSTATGESRQVPLASGGQLWLNTATAVDIDAKGPRIKLISGEMQLDDRLAVDSKVHIVTTLGELRSHNALLNLRLASGSACLDVYAGAVELLCNGQRLTVQQGQQVTFARHGARAPVPVQDAHRSWVKGVLVAEGAPLGQVVAELARYRHGHLGCDPRIAGLTVVGTFSVVDTDRALASLSSALPVKVSRLMPWWVSLEARA